MMTIKVDYAQVVVLEGDLEFYWKNALTRVNERFNSFPVLALTAGALYKSAE